MGTNSHMVGAGNTSLSKGREGAPCQPALLSRGHDERAFVARSDVCAGVERQAQVSVSPTRTHHILYMPPPCASVTDVDFLVVPKVCWNTAPDSEGGRKSSVGDGPLNAKGRLK